MGRIYLSRKNGKSQQAFDATTLLPTQEEITEYNKIFISLGVDVRLVVKDKEAEFKKAISALERF